MPRGDLFIVSAPSGAGKTTLIQRMLASGLFAPESLVFSVSHTTRRPRAGEVEGVAYHFVSAPSFEQTIAEGGFLEWANVYGNYYGTSRDEVMPRLERGVDVLLDIDVQGAEQVRAAYPAAISIFILPPSYESLRERLERRALDDPSVMARRLGVALSEIQQYDRYQYVIVNEDKGRAGAELAAIVLDKRKRLARMEDEVARTLARFEALRPAAFSLAGENR